MNSQLPQGSVFIVGLAGPSGSGKSTVARRVASRLNGHVVSLEIYSAEMNHLPFEERAKLDYDAPKKSADRGLLPRCNPSPAPVRLSSVPLPKLSS